MNTEDVMDLFRLYLSGGRDTEVEFRLLRELKRRGLQFTADKVPDYEFISKICIGIQKNLTRYNNIVFDRVTIDGNTHVNILPNEDRDFSQRKLQTRQYLYLFKYIFIIKDGALGETRRLHISCDDSLSDSTCIVEMLYNKRRYHGATSTYDSMTDRTSIGHIFANLKFLSMNLSRDEINPKKGLFEDY